MATHPRVEVLAAYFAPPLDDEALRRIETDLGMPLGGTLQALYREIGAVQVVWRCVPPRTPTATLPDPTVRYDEGADLTNRDDIDGAIEIFPPAVGPMYAPGHTEVVDDRTLPWTLFREFDRGIYYYAAMLVALPALPEPRVVLVEDYYADVHPASLSVDAYLAYLVQNLGYVPRERHAGCEGVAKELGLGHW